VALEGVDWGSVRFLGGDDDDDRDDGGDDDRDTKEGINRWITMERSDAAGNGGESSSIGDRSSSENDGTSRYKTNVKWAMESILRATPCNTIAFIVRNGNTQTWDICVLGGVERSDAAGNAIESSSIGENGETSRYKTNVKWAMESILRVTPCNSIAFCGRNGNTIFVRWEGWSYRKQQKRRFNC